MKKQQQQEINKFLNQVSTTSNNLISKLLYHKSFILLPHQMKNEDDSSDSNKSSPLNTKYKQNKIPCKTSNNLIQKVSDTKNLSSNWPDISEINSTLEEFDIMLSEYEIDYDQKGIFLIYLDKIWPIEFRVLMQKKPIHKKISSL